MIVGKNLKKSVVLFVPFGFFVLLVVRFSSVLGIGPGSRRSIDQETPYWIGRESRPGKSKKHDED
jgi:hypothetical protein